MIRVIFFVFLLQGLALGESVTNDSEMEYDEMEASPLSINCMRCLYKVMRCWQKDGCRGTVCGVFCITQQYWEVTNYLSHDSANTAAYKNCTTNVWCATETVQRHMQRFLPACEAKRPDRLFCENALALHMLGSNNCHHDLTQTLQRNLHKCMDKKVWKWLEDAENK